MNDQPIDTPQPLWLRFAPGNPVLNVVNWGGLKTLYIKEVRRFFKVQMQTVWAPAVTDLALSRDLHGRDGPFGAHGDGCAFR